MQKKRFVMVLVFNNESNVEKESPSRATLAHWAALISVIAISTSLHCELATDSGLST